jgi:asparagine synthase (glutamine-hydrolysing)
MCGICGVIDWSGAPVAAAEVAAMCAAQAHRGPDGEGAHLEPAAGAGAAAVGLGHRRLAVIDLRTGDQPMFNEDGSVVVVFNGEIYNFVALRAELQAHGHRFRSAGDTEVLVHGYEQWGEALVARLDGMFAFALWDRARQRLLLARDPAGKKPLYWARDGARLAFASEIGALRRALHGGPTGAPDLTALPVYLVLGYVPGAATAFTGVRQLLPGHLAVAEAGERWREQRYWDLPYASPAAAAPGRRDDAHLRALVRAAVEKRLVADVPIGALLSGGVDSAAVVATMRDLREEVHTFTVGMVDRDGYDESAHARALARHLGTIHHEMTVEPDVLRLVAAVVEHHQEPFADASAVPTFLISKFARQHVTVVLTGDGGDEVFGGYPRLAAAAYGERLPASARVLAGALGRAVGPGARHGDLRSRLSRLADRLALPLGERLLSWISVFDAPAVHALLEDPGPDRAAFGPGPAGTGEARRQFETLVADAHEATPLGRALYLNFHTYLPDDLLRKVDRASMAVGLEVRCPLLDRALMEHVARLPDSAKVSRLRLKASLRSLLRGRVPAETLSRRKQGFGLPLGRWFRDELRELVRDCLLGADSRLRGLVRTAAVQALFEDNLARRRDTGQQLWALLVLEQWLRRVAAPAAVAPQAPSNRYTAS